MNILSVDLGGTNVDFAVVDIQSQTILYQNSFKTISFQSIEACRDKIYEDVNQHFKGEIQGIGIGAPSVNVITQQIEYAPNLKHWEDVISISELFEEKFNLPTHSINDATAAALGELHFSEHEYPHSFAVVTLGTGVGLGLIINGKHYDGANGLGGEFGHICIERHNGRECGCGNYGCLETYVGKEGILKTAREKIEFGSGITQLNQIIPSELKVKDIFNLARKEDPIAIAVVDSVAADLGFALSILMSTLDITTICLSGGIAKEGIYFVKKS